MNTIYIYFVIYLVAEKGGIMNYRKRVLYFWPRTYNTNYSIALKLACVKKKYA